MTGSNLDGLEKNAGKNFENFDNYGNTQKFNPAIIMAILLLYYSHSNIFESFRYFLCEIGISEKGKIMAKFYRYGDFWHKTQFLTKMKA